jgi:enamine deaminase RidA (YjgF/YER057c/UK114 family)
MIGSAEDASREDTKEACCVRCLDGERTLDLFVAVAPASMRDDDAGQFASMAARALDAIAARGLSPGNIVCGWIHMARTPAWDWREALARAWDTSGPLPITALLQPPAEPFRFCTLQLHVIRSARQSGVWHGSGAGPAAATVLRHGARHLRLMAITPRPELADAAPMADLVYDMLAQAGHALTARGLGFSDVVRTWIYVQDIERNYGFVNQARNRYFGEQRLARLPASTCVQGTLPGALAPVAMDLYAVAAGSEVRVDALSPGPMGEATAYGSAFARGSRITEPGRSTLYVSGTASIDARGGVVAVGDIAGQLACMFDNVRALLTAAGMELRDTLSATVYLKSAEHLRAFVEAAAAAGLPADVPAAVVVTQICRPEWLCEIELCAARLASVDKT